MICPQCNGDNPDDYQFCIHCGAPHTPTIDLEAAVPSSLQEKSAPPAQVERAAPAKKPSYALVKKKWFIILLLLLPILCCFLLAVVIVLVLVKSGVLGSGGGSNQILLGIPSRSNQSDLYLLRLGDDLRDARLVAEDAAATNLYFNYIQEEETFTLGSYMENFGGFVPEQKLLVTWYQNEQGEVIIQRQALNQDAPIPIHDLDEASGYGRVLNDGEDIFINEEVSGEERCYLSKNGEPAQRIAKGDTCSLTQDGSAVLTWQVEDNAITLTIMPLVGGEEITLLDTEQNIESYRASYDGSRVATLSGETEQHITLLDGSSGESILLGPPALKILSYTFAAQAHKLIYVAENDEGDLSLYLMDDESVVLLASAPSLDAEISQDGDYVIYLSTEENQPSTVTSHQVSNGQNTIILQQDDLRISLADDLERVFISQQDTDALTLFSANLDGGDLVTLFEDDRAAHAAIFHYPQRSELFILTYNDQSEASLFYTPSDESRGYYLIQDYTALEINDVSADGRWLLTTLIEDKSDDPALVAIELQPEGKMTTLDDSEVGFSTAVFSQNSKQVIYTAHTGYNPDDREVRQADLDGEQAAERLYAEAYLVDVQWTQMSHWSGIYFNEPFESTSYCPGAAVISEVSSMEGMLTVGGSVCYRFQAEADSPFTFNVEADAFDATLELYDRTGFLLDRDDDSGPGLNPRLVAILPEAGTYYLKVSVYGGGTGPYSLSMQPGISDASLAVPLESNTVLRDYINSSDQIYLESIDTSTYGVLYSFDGSANEAITIDVQADSLGSQIDPFITLYDAAMNILITDDDSGADYDAQIIYRLPADGRYYLLVEDLGDEYGPEADYWFDILLTR